MFFEVFLKHGVPDSIISDRGSIFTSSFWAEIAKLSGIRRDLSTAYHPQTDGQTERTNQVLEQYLRCYLDYDMDNWVELLPLAEFAHNTQHHSALGMSPFEATYGYKASFIPSFSAFYEENQEDTLVPAALDFAKSLKAQHDQLVQELKFSQTRMAISADKTRRPVPDFKVGEYVWLDARDFKTERAMKKLDHKFFGPFKVLKKVNANAYELELPISMSRKHPVFNVSKLWKALIDEQRAYERPPPVLVEDGEEFFEIERILKERKVRGGKRQYLIKWKGYPDTDNTWVDEDDVTGKEAIQEFESRKKTSQRSRKRGILSQAVLQEMSPLLGSSEDVFATIRFLLDGSSTD
jgi:hypothetical protein